MVRRPLAALIVALCLSVVSVVGVQILDSGPAPQSFRTFSLSIDSIPQGVPFNLRNVALTTPYIGPLPAGDHTIEMPAHVVLEGVTYQFRSWSDGDPHPLRVIHLEGDSALSAWYVRLVAAPVVAYDSNTGVQSLTTMGGHKFLVDGQGKRIVVYVNGLGSISVAVNNGDPTTDGWSPPLVSARGFWRPAAVLRAEDEMHVLAERNNSIVDVVVHLSRDPGGNIMGGTFDPPVMVGPGGLYPSAIRAHDGSLWATWSLQQGSGSTRNARLMAGHWTPGSGWAVQALAVDTRNPERFYSTIIERPDTFTLYVFANRGEQSPDRNMTFAAAAFAGGVWTWRAADPAYETVAARGISDSVSAAWDPVRGRVVVVNDHTGTPSYFALTLDSRDVKAHLDTPDFDIVNNDWGTILVDPATGDYYLLFMETFGNTLNGRLLYTRWNGTAWSNVTVIDEGNSDIAIQTAVGSSSLEFVFGHGFKAGSVQIHYGRIG